MYTNHQVCNLRLFLLDTQLQLLRLLLSRNSRMQLLLLVYQPTHGAQPCSYVADFLLGLQHLLRLRDQYFSDLTLVLCVLFNALLYTPLLRSHACQRQLVLRAEGSGSHAGRPRGESEEG